MALKITKASDPLMRDMERPVRGYMQPGDGKDCPCWEAGT